MDSVILQIPLALVLYGIALALAVSTIPIVEIVKWFTSLFRKQKN